MMCSCIRQQRYEQAITPPYYVPFGFVCSGGLLSFMMIESVGVLAALLLVLVVVYRRARRELITAAEFRRGSQYSEVALQDGITAYREIVLTDNEPKHTIVIIHGGTIGSVSLKLSLGARNSHLVKRVFAQLLMLYSSHVLHLSTPGRLPAKG